MDRLSGIAQLFDRSDWLSRGMDGPGIVGTEPEIPLRDDDTACHGAGGSDGCVPAGAGVATGSPACAATGGAAGKTVSEP